MELLFTIVIIIVLAFICEYIDSSVGMGYGTILTPILILSGYHPLLVIPSILISQGIASFSAAIFHQRYGNIDLRLKGEDAKIASFIIMVGVLIAILAIFIVLSIQISETYLETYIGVVVMAMGIILLHKRKFDFSWNKLIFIGIFSAFNKALTGGGYGPIMTSGQVISGKEPRSSIGITTLAEAPICIVSFLVYIFFEGSIDPSLPILLCIGALLATPFGPQITAELEETRGRRIIGVYIIFLGVFIITKNFIWPHITIFTTNPFFWAFISMFALIGSSATLCSRQLGRFPRLNMILVAIFGLGRFMLVLPLFEQPRFDMFGMHLIIGGILFIIGLIFLTPLLIITPWPESDHKTNLVSTGLYSIVRNPIYLGEVLWSLGWAIMFRSIIGVALVPLWWGGLLFHVILEEEELERKLGQKYLEYKTRVQGRIFPGLPI